MPARERSVPLSGSEKKPVAGATEAGPVAPNERFEVTIVLKPVKREGKQRPRLSREEFSKSRGASKEDIEKIKKFAKEHSLRVVEASAARRSIILSGTASQFRDAFQVELKRYHHPSTQKPFRGRSGPIYVPESLSPVVSAVLGLDNRPQARAHHRPVRPGAKALTTYTAPQISQVYDFPSGLNGSGECIGLIELGGGENPSDLATYFQGLGLAPPQIMVVPVDGGSNAPTGDPTGPDGEVMLDIEIAGGIAPASTVAIYFAPNTDQGFVDAITTAINDDQNKPSVISISWGSAESTWTSQAIQSLNQALDDAATLGVTVCCAAGDGGSSDGVSDGLAHVDFPASSPYALACGGTSIVSTTGAIKEKVWNELAQGGGATGGGVSDVFPLPSWQASANVPPSVNPGGHVGRGVPDVAGDADPTTGYSVRVDGTNTILGGTSAVAPLWAGLIALMNQKLGRSLGYINPLLYPVPESDFHDVTSGNNGAYSAGPGWDACTGLGTPDGAKLLAVISTASTS
jgi:kumamolisin